MSLERIAASTSLRPERGQAGPVLGANPSIPVAAGETIRLTLETTAAGGMLGTTADGLQLRLNGLESLAETLAPGEVLNLRVLSTTPRLELALLNAVRFFSPVAAEVVDPAKIAAMRPDQAAVLGQVIAQRPDATVLASTWHAMALDHLERNSFYSGQLFELRLPAELHMARAAFSAPGAEPNAAHLAPGAEQWPFAPVAYGSHRMMLQVIDEEDEPRRKRKGRRAVIALLLDSNLPGLGRVLVRMQLLAGGVWIDLCCEEKASASLRKLLPDFVASVARSDLKLVRCRLMRHALSATPDDAIPLADVSSTLALPSPLFSAAAEILLLLSSPSLPALLNRRFR